MNAWRKYGAPPSRITRRTLLKTGGAAAVGLALPATAAAHRHRIQSHLRRSSYRPLIGHRFGLRGTAHKLRLVTVQDLNQHQARSDNAFALIFRAPPGAPQLAQDLPTSLQHPALGHFKLLLSSGSASSQGQRYAAIINRLRA